MGFFGLFKAQKPAGDSMSTYKALCQDYFIALGRIDWPAAHADEFHQLQIRARKALQEDPDASLEQEIETLITQLELERMKLAYCGSVARGTDPNTIEDKYWNSSLASVMGLVERERNLREKVKELSKKAQELADKLQHALIG